MHTRISWTSALLVSTLLVACGPGDADPDDVTADVTPSDTSRPDTTDRDTREPKDTGEVGDLEDTSKPGDTSTDAAEDSASDLEDATDSTEDIDADTTTAGDGRCAVIGMDPLTLPASDPTATLTLTVQCEAPDRVDTGQWRLVDAQTGESVGATTVTEKGIGIFAVVAAVNTAEEKQVDPLESVLEETPELRRALPQRLRRHLVADELRLGVGEVQPIAGADPAGHRRVAEHVFAGGNTVVLVQADASDTGLRVTTTGADGLEIATTTVTTSVLDEQAQVRSFVSRGAMTDDETRVLTLYGVSGSGELFVISMAFDGAGTPVVEQVASSSTLGTGLAVLDAMPVLDTAAGSTTELPIVHALFAVERSDGTRSVLSSEAFRAGLDTSLDPVASAPSVGGVAVDEIVAGTAAVGLVANSTAPIADIADGALWVATADGTTTTVQMASSAAATFGAAGPRLTVARSLATTTIEVQFMQVDDDSALEWAVAGVDRNSKGRELSNWLGDANNPDDDRTPIELELPVQARWQPTRGLAHVRVIDGELRLLLTGVELGAAGRGEVAVDLVYGAPETAVGGVLTPVSARVGLTPVTAAQDTSQLETVVLTTTATGASVLMAPSGDAAHEELVVQVREDLVGPTHGRGDLVVGTGADGGLELRWIVGKEGRRIVALHNHKPAYRQWTWDDAAAQSADVHPAARIWTDNGGDASLCGGLYPADDSESWQGVAASSAEILSCQPVSTGHRLADTATDDEVLVFLGEDSGGGRKLTTTTSSVIIGGGNIEFQDSSSLSLLDSSLFAKPPTGIEAGLQFHDLALAIGDQVDVHIDGSTWLARVGTNSSVLADASAERTPLTVFTVEPAAADSECAVETVAYTTSTGGKLDPSSREVVGTGTTKDCVDLPWPVGQGDFLGTGGNQAVFMKQSPAGTRFSLGWRCTDAAAARDTGGLVCGGTDHFLPPPPITEPLAAPVVLADLNGDGLTDIGVPTAAGVQILFSDGRGGTLDTQAVTIPVFSDLDLPGAPSGPLGTGSGFDPAYAGFGKGTRNSASNAAAKPELL